MDRERGGATGEDKPAATENPIAQGKGEKKGEKDEVFSI